MSEHGPVDLEALGDLRTPWCLRVVATLRVADHMAAGLTDTAAVARAAGCDPDALRAVLGQLAERGVFEQTTPGEFALNGAARQLLDESQRLGLDLEGIGGRMSYVWSTLPAYIRTGTPAYHEVFGLPFWEDLDANPKIAASFDALIGPMGHGAPDPDFEIAGGWAAIHTVVDVGGGTGAMLAGILRTRPSVHGTLVDRPRTVARAAATFEAAGVTARATTLGQSFFDPLPAGADLYILRGVLNDWPDRDAVRILRRCADAARPGGRVVILKGMADDNALPRLEIEMVLAGGKPRTAAQFRQLAGEAHLEVIAAGRQRAYSVVECRPV